MEIPAVSIPETHKIPAYAHELRVAGILDELSEKFFPYECKFTNLGADTWEEQIVQLNPHILFVESVWNGYQKTWRGKITSRDNSEFVRLVNWCKERSIPTFFWNKEDPIHMFTFLGAAFLFDYVFTTDMDCVPLYKRLLGHNRVGVLPFAAAIQLFNPIETYQRKEAACFAGSYYARREERRQDFENIADVLIENYALDIYDRNPYPNNPDYTFPERFRPHIKGTLSVDEVDRAYKSYRLGITLNIVKHSSTMEARRIFELLSCNTLTASNTCSGIKNLFGDLVLYNDDSKQFAAKIKEIVSDESVYNRLRLLGLRKVLQEHTYKERVEYLYTKANGKPPKSTSPQIGVYSIVENMSDVQRVSDAFTRQNYPDKKLFLFVSDGFANFESHPEIYPLAQFHSVLAHDFDFFAFFRASHYYGKNYLVDLALATRYATVSAIGKSAYFSAMEGKPTYTEGLGAYQFVDRLQLDRSMLASYLLSTVDPQNQNEAIWVEHLPCLSIDAYNFCENYSGENCPEVDDLEVNQGISMDALYQISDSLTPGLKNYELGFQLTGSDFRAHTIFPKKVFRVEDHPLGYFAFYSLDNSTQKTCVNKDINLSGLTIVNELTGKQNLYVYVNARIEGEINFHVNYYAESGEFLGEYLVLNQACTAIPVPEKAASCNLSISTRGSVQGLVKEVLFGPQLLDALDLRAREVT